MIQENIEVNQINAQVRPENVEEIVKRQTEKIDKFLEQEKKDEKSLGQETTDKDIEKKCNFYFNEVHGRKHLFKINFEKDTHQIKKNAPSLASLTSWDNIPSLAIITGKNGSGKTQLLNYIHTQLDHFKHCVIFQEANIYHTGSQYPNYRRQPNYLINSENQQYLFQDIINYYSNIDDLRRMDPLAKEIIKQIENGILEKPNKETNLELWKKSIANWIDRHRDFVAEEHNINDPLSILNQAYHIYNETIGALMIKYKNSSFFLDLFNFYCEQHSKDNNTNERTFANLLQSEEYQNQIIALFIQEELGHKSPLEEVNRILESYHFSYRFQASDNKKNLVLIRETEKDKIKIEHDMLSSGEIVILKLLSQLFYFRGVSSDGKNPAPIKHLDIMLLDEPDRHLDPELCKKMYKIIHKEFVEKHHVQVFMTTHRPDAVFLAPDNSIYTIGEGNLQQDQMSAFHRMAGNIISPVINKRSASSILSGGKLTVIEDTNFVYTENEIDSKFYSIIYQKLRSAFPSTSKTHLIFMPVGIKVLSIQKEMAEIKSTVGEMKKLIEQLAPKAEQCEALVATLCQRFTNATPQDSINISYCLQLLTYNNNSLSTLSKSFDCYNNKLENEIVKNHMLSIVQKAKESSLEIINQATIDEIETKIKSKQVKKQKITQKQNQEDYLDTKINQLMGLGDLGGGCCPIKKKVNLEKQFQGEYNKHGVVKTCMKEVNAKNHLNVLWGIVDFDNGNSKANGKVYNLDAYSLENYLCYPLNLFYYIRKYTKIEQLQEYLNDVESRDMFVRILEGKDNEFEIGNSSENHLQLIVNWTTGYIKKQYNESIGCYHQIVKEKPTEKSLKLIGNKTVNILDTFVNKRGHDLAKDLGKHFKIYDEKIIVNQLFGILELIPVNYLPQSLYNLIDNLQTSKEATAK